MFFKDWSHWFDWYLIGTRMIEFQKEWKKEKKKRRRSFFASCVLHFLKYFSFLFVLFSLDRSNPSFFCHFPPQIFKGFCPQVWVRPKYPSFFNLFTFFMHFSHYFWTKDFWGFWFLGCFCSNLLIGFLFLDDIYMIPMH